jgi:hypothetical protein
MEIIRHQTPHLAFQLVDEPTNGCLSRVGMFTKNYLRENPWPILMCHELMI